MPDGVIGPPDRDEKEPLRIMVAVAGRSVHSETGQSARLDVAESSVLVPLRARSESCEWQPQCSDLAAVAVQVSGKATSE